MRGPLLMLAACAVVLGCAAPAIAQTPPPGPKLAAPVQVATPPPARRGFTVAVGPGLDKIITTSGQASNPWVWRFAFRLPQREGWSPAMIFGWFDTTVDGAQFGPEQAIGQLQIRPVMGGVRYTWIRDAWSYDVAAAAGPSFSGFDLAGSVARTLPRTTGAIRADANTSPAFTVQGSAWYDVTDKVAVRGSIGWFMCRPDVTVTASGVSRRFSQSANALQLGASVVYRIF